MPSQEAAEDESDEGETIDGYYDFCLQTIYLLESNVGEDEGMWMFCLR